MAKKPLLAMKWQREAPVKFASLPKRVAKKKAKKKKK